MLQGQVADLATHDLSSYRLDDPPMAGVMIVPHQDEVDALIEVRLNVEQVLIMTTRKSGPRPTPVRLMPRVDEAPSDQLVVRRCP